MIAHERPQPCRPASTACPSRCPNLARLATRCPLARTSDPGREFDDDAPTGRRPPRPTRAGAAQTHATPPRHNCENIKIT